MPTTRRRTTIKQETETQGRVKVETQEVSLSELTLSSNSRRSKINGKNKQENVKENQIGTVQDLSPSNHGRRSRTSRLLKQFEPNLRQDEVDLKPTSRKRAVKIEVSPQRGASPAKMPSTLKREMKKESTEDETEDSGDETEEDQLNYEKMREQNLRANAEFIASLGILEAKQNLAEAHQKKSKPSQRGLKREKVPVEILPKRRSLRIQKVGPPTPIYVPEELTQTYDGHPRPPAGALNMEDYLYDQHEPEDHQEFVKVIGKDIKKTKIITHSASLQSFEKEFSKLKLTEDGVAKVVKNRNFSIAIHPMCDKVLVAAGDKWGQVGFWDVTSKAENDGVVVYCPHSRPVNCLRLPDWAPLKTFSCSYDGTLRLGDFEKGVFDEIYSVPEDEDVLLRNFDFHSEHSLVVSQSDGCVAVVDMRTARTTPEHVYPCHPKPLRTVSIHPVQKNYFITASVDRTVRLWDLRKMNEKRNFDLAELVHGKSVDSAYFSPVTGKHILSTSSDNTLNIFDSSDLTLKLSLEKKIRHDNNVGRWLTKFRATWHPARDDVFVVGSMHRPRQIELYSDKGVGLGTLKSDHLASVCSLNEIHPSRNVLVGGNSSGRLHVFM